MRNQYEAEQETRERAHSSAVRSLTESHDRTKQQLSRAEAAGLPPRVSVANPSPPSGPDEPDPLPHAAVEKKGVLRDLHAATLEYWEEVRPHRRRVVDKWQEPLLRVSYPVAGDWETQPGRHGADPEVRGIDTEPVVVSLDTLGKWRFSQVVLGWRRDTRGACEERTRAEKVYLPPIACQQVFEQLNDILDELGLAAEVREAGGTDTDPGTPEDVDAWGRADSGQTP